MHKIYFTKLFTLFTILFLVGCQASSTTNRDPVFLFLLTNNSYEVFHSPTFPSQFVMNLNVYHPKNVDLEQGGVVSVEMLPQTHIVQLSSFLFDYKTEHVKNASTALFLRFDAKAAGEHTFSEIQFTTKDQEHRIPVTSIQVKVSEGNLANVFVLPQNGGIFAQPQPHESLIENLSSETLIIQPPTMNNAYVQLRPQDVDVTVDGRTTQIPAGGFSLAPGQKVRLTLNWAIAMPSTGTVNIELQPLLTVTQGEQVTYFNLHSMVFRRY